MPQGVLVRAGRSWARLRRVRRRRRQCRRQAAPAASPQGEEGPQHERPAGEGPRQRQEERGHEGGHGRAQTEGKAHR